VLDHVVTNHARKRETKSRAPALVDRVRTVNGKPETRERRDSADGRCMAMLKIVMDARSRRFVNVVESLGSDVPEAQAARYEHEIGLTFAHRHVSNPCC
jgi:hypothetical protein